MEIRYRPNVTYRHHDQEGIISKLTEVHLGMNSSQGLHKRVYLHQFSYIRNDCMTSCRPQEEIKILEAYNESSLSEIKIPKTFSSS